MAPAKLTVSERKLLSSSEIELVESARGSTTHTDSLVKNLRSLRKLRDKYRDASAKQVRAIKTGKRLPVRPAGLNERTHQKLDFFQNEIVLLENRLRQTHESLAREIAPSVSDNGIKVPAELRPLVSRARKAVSEYAHHLRSNAGDNLKSLAKLERLEAELNASLKK